ncbi:hypothetical protein BH18THE2_BH18THE2_26160 [soil metagenome]
MNANINALSLWKSGGQNVDFTADNSLPLNAVLCPSSISLLVSLSPGGIFKGATLGPPFVGSTSEGEIQLISCKDAVLSGKRSGHYLTGFG